VPLELGGKRSKRIAVSEATIRATEAELSAMMAQVRNDVRRSHFDLLVASQRLTVLRELRDLSERARDTAQVRFDSGDVPRLEVLQAELALIPVIPVRLSFSAPVNLPVGLPAQVEIEAERHQNVVLVSADSVVREGDETAVFLLAAPLSLSGPCSCCG
jgi:hypothetical protein